MIEGASHFVNEVNNCHIYISPSQKNLSWMIKIHNEIIEMEEVEQIISNTLNSQI